MAAQAEGVEPAPEAAAIGPEVEAQPLAEAEQPEQMTAAAGVSRLADGALHHLLCSSSVASHART